MGLVRLGCLDVTHSSAKLTSKHIVDPYESMDVGRIGSFIYGEKMLDSVSPKSTRGFVRALALQDSGIYTLCPKKNALGCWTVLARVFFCLANTHMGHHLHT